MPKRRKRPIAARTFSDNFCLSKSEPLEAQARLIRDGEAATPQSLELEKQAKAASNADDLDDEESEVEIDEEFDDAGEQE